MQHWICSAGIKATCILTNYTACNHKSAISLRCLNINEKTVLITINSKSSKLYMAHQPTRTIIPGALSSLEIYLKMIQCDIRYKISINQTSRFPSNFGHIVAWLCKATHLYIYRTELNRNKYRQCCTVQFYKINTSFFWGQGQMQTNIHGVGYRWHAEVNLFPGCVCSADCRIVQGCWELQAIWKHQ